MLAKVKCVTFKGLEVVEVDVEVNITKRGLPAFDIVGLPNKSVEESKHRIKSAFINSGFDFPDYKITVNLAPADLLKKGSAFDLPVAVGIYCAVHGINPPSNAFFFGELSLTGQIRAARGTYLLADYANNNGSSIFVSPEMLDGFDVFRKLSIFAPIDLASVFNHVSGKTDLKSKPVSCSNHISDTIPSSSLFNDIIGQEFAKRALIISAAGNHNLMLTGSPGTGKTMLARSIISLLPALTDDEAHEIRKIYSYTKGGLPLELKRPFRNPHHTISYIGMLGGGVEPLPGEITLAHRGVLFMDEFCEFSRPVLEALRQPMQDGEVVLSRRNETYRFPANFTLIAASNPCPCGYYGHPYKKCICSDKSVANYNKRLSGPLADRFDLFADVFPEDSFMTINENYYKSTEKPDSNVRLLATISDCKAKDRYRSHDKNSKIKLERAVQSMLNTAYTKLHFSPRAYFKIIRVARTIADLDNCSDIKEHHLAEALQYRQR